MVRNMSQYNLESSEHEGVDRDRHLDFLILGRACEEDLLKRGLDRVSLVDICERSR